MAAQPPLRGLYLWGGVGRGKTLLMDLFYECLPVDDRLRMHFHRFMQRVHHELNELAEFISEGIAEVAREANEGLWRGDKKVRVNITGLWFQISNNHAFHEMHVHGNCSWSGVYYVRSAECAKSLQSSSGQQPNGITRFYGPHVEHMAGGFGDYGNLYLHDNHWDSFPEDGKLCIFPSHIKHMPFPYSGEEDRVIVSFHAQVFNSSGTQSYDYGFNN